MKQVHTTKRLRIGKRPQTINSTSYKIQLSTCGTLYITVGVLDNGRIFEVFLTIGKSGSCQRTMLDSLARMVSISLRAGVPLKDIIKQFDGASCDKPSFVPDLGLKRAVYSCPDALAQILKKWEK